MKRINNNSTKTSKRKRKVVKFSLEKELKEQKEYVDYDLKWDCEA